MFVIISESIIHVIKSVKFCQVALVVEVVTNIWFDPLKVLVFIWILPDEKIRYFAATILLGSVIVLFNKTLVVCWQTSVLVAFGNVIVWFADGKTVIFIKFPEFPGCKQSWLAEPVNFTLLLKLQTINSWYNLIVKKLVSTWGVLSLIPYEPPS